MLYEIFKSPEIGIVQSLVDTDNRRSFKLVKLFTGKFCQKGGIVCNSFTFSSLTSPFFSVVKWPWSNVTVRKIVVD